MRDKSITDGLYITEDYCAFYKPKKAVFISDLHLGYGRTTKGDGMETLSLQKEKILDRLSDIKNRYDPNKLFVLGDFKHNFGRSEDDEFRDILDIMDYMLKGTSVEMLKGNHDNYLKNMTNIKDIGLHDKSIEFGFLRLTHGHLDIELKENSFLIIGHEHPTLEIKDELGTKMRYPVFLYNPQLKKLVLPSFNPMVKGRNILRSDSPLTPNIENFDEFQVFAITERGIKDFKTVFELKNIF